MRLNTLERIVHLVLINQRKRYDLDGRWQRDGPAALKKRKRYTVLH